MGTLWTSLVLLSSGAWSCGGEAPKTVSASVLAQPLDQELKMQQYDVLTEEVGASLAANAAASTAFVIMEGLRAGGEEPQQSDDLQRELLEVLEMYLDGSYEVFLAYCSEKGISVPWLNQIADHPQREEFWELKSEMLREAPMRTSGMSVRARVRGGEEILYDDQTAVVFAERPDRIPWLSDPLAQGADVFEILIPMRITGIDMKASDEIKVPREFDGRLGLWFAQLDQEHPWVLSKIGIYDVPDGTYLSMPPF